MTTCIRAKALKFFLITWGLGLHWIAASAIITLTARSGADAKAAHLRNPCCRCIPAMDASV